VATDRCDTDPPVLWIFESHLNTPWTRDWPVARTVFTQDNINAEGTEAGLYVHDSSVLAVKDLRPWTERTIYSVEQSS
jgi:hypothetical protein